MQPFERDLQERCVIQKTRQASVPCSESQNVDW